jgi:hypothetical protein
VQAVVPGTLQPDRAVDHFSGVNVAGGAIVSGATIAPALTTAVFVTVCVNFDTSSSHLVETSIDGVAWEYVWQQSPAGTRLMAVFVLPPGYSYRVTAGAGAVVNTPWHWRRSL